MRISIFGLGYVGAVSLACLARDGHHVVGVDIDDNKLDLIRRGISPVVETGMNELTSQAAAAGNVETTNDASYGVSNTDVSFICVGTPCHENGSQNLDAIKRLSTQLGEGLKTKADFHVFVVRSTVIPGTVENIIAPLVEASSGKKEGQDFSICFQPEFLREGSSIKDYDNPPFTLVGTDSDEAQSKLRQIFGHLPGEFIVTSIETAELLKYCCNAFHALKVTFANEIGRVSKSIGVDSRAVMDIVCRDTRLNVSKAYLRPGFAFGGSCLPKDLRALVRLGQDNDVGLPMLSALMPSNLAQIDHAVRMIRAEGRPRVGLVGLSFKSGTDDLRESPLVILAEQLIGKGVPIRVYDPEVNLARVIGTNRRYIDESIPHMTKLMEQDFEQLISNSDVIVLGLNNPDLIDQLRKMVRTDQMVLDLIGMSDAEEIAGRYCGICW